MIVSAPGHSPDRASPELVAQYRAHVESLTKRASAVLAAEQLDAMVVHSGSLVKRSEFDDQYWPLRTVPHFQHWAHVDWPECAIHLVAGQRPRLLFQRDRNFWERPREPDWTLLGSALELVEVTSTKTMASLLGDTSKLAWVGENTKRATEWGIDASRVNPKGLLAGLDELRVFKTPYEITCLRVANQIASRGHAIVRDAFLAGERSELKLHLLYLEATSQDDPETPYKNIVALGETASILHHVHYRRTPIDASSLLLDAGATYQGYASDITRTYVARGDAASNVLFGELISKMESLQKALVAGVKVGRPYETLHDEAHDRLGAVLTELGIVKMSPEECVESGVSRKFLPHGLGHSLGLQTHDVGCAKIRPRDDNPFLRNTRTIEPGQVFTIEPGVYFIDTFMDELRGGPFQTAIDWQKIDALRPYGGVRIEDDVVVLADSSVTTSDNLTRETLE
ncbi:Xaa-Pro dipeptidase [Myxococcota bacterium]|nr:Xaa-Pro dipeptidase [Myxococcota bacterium]